MTQEEREKKKARLDALGKEWCCLKATPGNESAADARQADIWALGFELYGTFNEYYSDAFNDVMMDEVLPKYDAQKGNPLHTFIGTRVQFRVTDRQRKETRDKDKFVPIDTPGEDSKGGEPRKIIEPKPIEPEPKEPKLKEEINEETIIFMTALIINFKSYQTGRAANDERQYYTKMFYTGGMIRFFREWKGDEGDVIYNHEQEINKALLLPFLDYCLTRKCRTVDELLMLEVKTLDRLVPGASCVEVKMPFQAKIYIAYLNCVEGKIVSDAVISKQQEYYHSYMSKINTMIYDPAV